MNTRLIMKSMLIKITLRSVLAGLLIILGGCGNTAEKGTTSRETTTTQVTPLAKKVFYINTINNESLAELSEDGDQWVVSMATDNLFGILKKAEKRKYYTQNDQLRYTVKYQENDFKLNDQNEALLYKVKCYADHIKIAYNNEMDDSYRIGRSSADRIKLKRNDEEISTLRLKMDDAFTTIKDRYTVRNFGNSLALGVLMMDEIPEEHKFILCAELLKKGL